MIDVTVIVMTFNRPEKCERAVASAINQTYNCRVMVANDGGPCSIDIPPGADHPDSIKTGRPDHWYLSVYDAVHRAQTPYVVVLCDDDWLEPTFVERCIALIGPENAFAFTDSAVRHPGGRSERHWPVGWMATGIHASDRVGDLLLAERRIVTPSCCLYRRSDVLRCLVPGGVPGFVDAMPYCHNPSGPDHLLALLTLLYYPFVGYVDEPLVNLDAWDESTTIQEMHGADGGAALQKNYDNSRKLYYLLREARRQGFMP